MNAPDFDIVARLLYRDALMLVIDKPAGLAVHASGRADHHLGHYLDRLRFGLPENPELAHRLDRDTAGCLVLGRHRRALRRLGALFSQGKIGKVYWAVVVGTPPGTAGVIDCALAKVGPAWHWRVRPDERGQPALTEWRLLGRGGRLSWIECRPKTGRTHQYRVHLATIGCPVAGDVIYGHGTADHAADCLHLHSRSVSVPLYPDKPAIAATAPVPAHMARALTQCGWSESWTETAAAAAELP